MKEISIRALRIFIENLCKFLLCLPNDAGWLYGIGAGSREQGGSRPPEIFSPPPFWLLDLITNI